jgi:hypothetical protein
MMKIDKVGNVVTPLSRVMAGNGPQSNGQPGVSGPQARGHQDIYVAEKIRGSYSRLLNGTIGSDAERQVQQGRDVAVKELGRKAKKILC